VPAVQVLVVSMGAAVLAVEVGVLHPAGWVAVALYPLQEPLPGDVAGSISDVKQPQVPWFTGRQLIVSLSMPAVP
jgi:hypothetical protein